MKNTITMAVALFAIASIAYAVPANIPKAPQAKEPTDTINIELSATSTISIPKYNTQPFQTRTLEGQGDCFSLHDKSGDGGITYITAENGVLSANSTGC